MTASDSAHHIFQIGAGQILRFLVAEHGGRYRRDGPVHVWSACDRGIEHHFWHQPCVYEAGAEVSTENKTREAGGSTATYYCLHVPLGRELCRLTNRYESLEEAKEAFERTRGGVARWCLVAAYEPGRYEDVPRFVLRASVHDQGARWMSLESVAKQSTSADRPKVTIQEQRMTKLLTPRLGFFTAEEVVRHVCARFQSADFADEKQLGDLREFMRLGLLAYMEPHAAEELAAKCAELD